MCLLSNYKNLFECFMYANLLIRVRKYIDTNDVRVDILNKRKLTERFTWN
jgi:hypothetical protein